MKQFIRAMTIIAVTGYYLGFGSFAQGAGLQAYDDLSLFLGKYGQPDRIKVTGSGTIQTSKQLMYVSENVRVVFVPDIVPGAQPSYSRWRLQNIYDLRTNRVLPPAEAARRLGTRKKR